MPRVKKYKGGAMTLKDYNKWLDTHDVETYVPKTPQEKQEYQDVVNFQQEYNEYQTSQFDVNDYEKYIDNWENKRQEGFQNALDTITTPEQLYSDNTKGKPDKSINVTPNIINGAKQSTGSKLPDKYYFDPFIYGYNQGLQHLYDTVPRPAKHTWADSFFEGLTAPFALASKLPIPVVKDIGEKVTKGFNAIGAPTLF